MTGVLLYLHSENITGVGKGQGVCDNRMFISSNIDHHEYAVFQFLSGNRLENFLAKQLAISVKQRDRRQICSPTRLWLLESLWFCVIQRIYVHLWIDSLFLPGVISLSNRCPIHLYDLSLGVLRGEILHLPISGWYLHLCFFCKKQIRFIILINIFCKRDERALSPQLF